MAEKNEPHPTLLDAVLAVQGEMTAIQKTGQNPAFKRDGKPTTYVSLDTLMESVMPLLNKHQLVWMTFPTVIENGAPGLGYRLAHASTGEKTEGEMPLLLDRQNPQGLGSAITYARRQTLMAVLGFVGDNDDDGNAASQPPRQQQPRTYPLSDDLAQRLRDSYKAAGVPVDWLRMQLVSVGAENVPEGQITQATIKALTPDQARKVIAACDEVVAAQAAA